MLQQAIDFATKAHKGQVRKYTNEPYINHPIDASAILVSLYPDATTEMMCTAILHDTVEDTTATIQDIEYLFGSKVAELVGWLTDVSKPEDGNRAQRKLLDREHTAKAPFEAQLIKCADLIDNSYSIVKHDPKFAVTYLEEKWQTLHSMRTSTKQEEIWLVAFRLCNDGLNKLQKVKYE